MDIHRIQSTERLGSYLVCPMWIIVDLKKIQSCQVESIKSLIIKTLSAATEIVFIKLSLTGISNMLLIALDSLNIFVMTLIKLIELLLE